VEEAEEVEKEVEDEEEKEEVVEAETEQEDAVQQEEKEGEELVMAVDLQRLILQWMHSCCNMAQCPLAWNTLSVSISLRCKEALMDSTLDLLIGLLVNQPLNSLKNPSHLSFGRWGDLLVLK